MSVKSGVDKIVSNFVRHGGRFHQQIKKSLGLSAPAFPVNENNIKGVGSSPPAFEGVEKKLIIQFEENFVRETCLPLPSLRALKDELWTELLRGGGCRIISKIRNESATAYLLSESSLFVMDNRIILKTCGTTTPLSILKPLLVTLAALSRAKEIEESFSLLVERAIDWMIYSHLSFQDPARQKHPHKCPEDEADYLDFTLGLGGRELPPWERKEDDVLTPSTTSPPSTSSSDFSDKSFKNDIPITGTPPHKTLSIKDEAAASQGPSKTSRSFILRTPKAVGDGGSIFIYVFSQIITGAGDVLSSEEAHDEVIEELMLFGIEENSVERYVKARVGGSQIDKLDEHFFSPVGYSCNVLGVGSDYLDVHISPEKQTSYASVERGLESRQSPLSSPLFVKKNIEIFKPREAYLFTLSSGPTPARLYETTTTLKLLIGKGRHIDLSFASYF